MRAVSAVMPNTALRRLSFAHSMPSFVPQMIELLGQDMDNSFGLRETAHRA